MQLVKYCFLCKNQYLCPLRIKCPWKCCASELLPGMHAWQVKNCH